MTNDLDSSIIKRDCESYTSYTGDVKNSEIRMSGTCEAKACGIFKIENPAENGDPHTMALCELHKKVTENGPLSLIGKIDNMQ